MSDKNINELEIAFESENIAKEFEKSVLHEIELKERLSAPFSLFADVLLPKPLPRKTLRNILGEKTKITIRAKLISSENGKTLYATRFVNGIVTKMRYEGIIFSGTADSERTNCARYRLTVEPVLSLLAKTRKTRTFRKLSPHEVIVSILKDYDIQPDISLVENDGDKNQFFQQQGESDLNFIHRLMRLYGLNYNFIHKDEGWDPLLVITNKWRFEPGDDCSAKVLYTDEEQAKTTYSDPLFLQGSVSSDEAGKIYIRRWIMEEACSAQSVNVGMDASNEEEEVLSWTMGDGLNQYETYYGKVPLENDRRRTTRLLKASLARENSLWRGETDSLSVSPGSLVQLQGIFGDDNESLTALTVQTELFIRSSWPNDLAFPPQEDLNAKPLVIQMQSLERMDDEDCGSFALITAVQDKLYSPQAASIYRGVVCRNEDAEGNLCSENETAQEFPTDVRVRIDGVKEPVTAMVTLAVGGDSSGFRYFPREGDNVLVAGFGGRWFIVSYLPELNAIDLPAGLRRQRLNSSEWRQSEGVGDYGLSESGSVNQISMTHNASKRDLALDLLLNGDVENYLQTRAISENNTDLFNVLEIIRTTGISSELDTRIGDGYACGYKKTVNAYLNAQKKVYELQTAQNEQAFSGGNELRSEEQNTALSELNRTWNNLCNVADYLADSTDSTDSTDSGLSQEYSKVKVTSKGDVEIKASNENGLLSCSSKDTWVSADDRLLLKSDGTVKIVAENKIHLQVGFNSLTIDNNGIVIRSLKGAKMQGGFLDSMIKLDSYSGVSISGLTTSMRGCLSATVSDGLGGSFTATRGSTRMGGCECAIATCNRYSAIKNGISFVTNVVTELFSLSGVGTTFFNVANSTVAAAMKWNNVLDEIKEAKAASYTQDRSKNSIPFGKAGFLMQVTIRLLDSLSSLIDLIILDLSATRPKWMATCHANGMTNRDYFVLVATSAKLLATLASLFPMYKKLSAGPLHASSICLTPEKIDFETVHKVERSQSSNEAMTPVAGTSANGTESSEDLDSFDSSESDSDE